MAVIDKLTETRRWVWDKPQGGAIGKRGLPLRDGFERASGKAVYTKDISLPGMLYAKFLLAPYTHANIKSVDVSAAQALPGVRAMMTSKDADLTYWWTGIEREIVNWYEQPVPVIAVADTELICDEALRLVKIQWEALPFVVDAEAALQPGAPIINPELNATSNRTSGPTTSNPMGDVDAGFKDATHVVEFHKGRVPHTFITPEAGVAVAQWRGDTLEVWSHEQDGDTHGPEELIKRGFSNKRNMMFHSPFQGAIYGGQTHGGYNEAMTFIAVMAAKRTNRPVKAIYDNMPFHGVESCTGTGKFKVGFKDDGTITAIQLESFGGGISTQKLQQSTSIKNYRNISNGARTNIGPSGPLKVGAPDCVGTTVVYEHVAGELKIDPLNKMALQCDGCNGLTMAEMAKEKTAQGFDATKDSLKDVIAAGKAASNWDNLWHLPGTKILPNGNYHGIGCMWQQSWANDATRMQPASVSLVDDGTVQILAWHPEVGTHTASALVNVIADEVGVAPEMVAWHSKDDVIYYAGIGNSSGMLWNVPQMARAAVRLKAAILDASTKDLQQILGAGARVLVAAEKAYFPGKKIEELDIKDSQIYEIANPSTKFPLTQLAAHFRFGLHARDDGPLPTPFTKYFFCRQLYIAEVEVDPETGKIFLKKTSIARDSGRTFSPEGIELQMLGSVIGLGVSHMEEVIQDPQTGAKLNDDYINYHMYTMGEIWAYDIRLVETGLGYGPYGSTGTGESGTCCADDLISPAVYNAIGKYCDENPVTPDKVLKALGKI